MMAQATAMGVLVTPGATLEGDATASATASGSIRTGKYDDQAQAEGNGRMPLAVVRSWWDHQENLALKRKLRIQQQNELIMRIVAADLMMEEQL